MIRGPRFTAFSLPFAAAHMNISWPKSGDRSVVDNPVCDITENEHAHKAAHYANIIALHCPRGHTRYVGSRSAVCYTIQPVLCGIQQFSNARLSSLDPDLQRHLPTNMLRSDATLLIASSLIPLLCRMWLGVAFTAVITLRLLAWSTELLVMCAPLKRQMNTSQ